MRVVGWGAIAAAIYLFASGLGQSEPPQEPHPPFPYSEEDVEIGNPAAPGVTLAGTLTRPNAGSYFPAILLITGAGPQDRDETTAGHKPFLVLADALTRRGLAVLRLDDRGTGRSKGKFEGATTQDFASDMQAALQYLRSRSDIEADHVGLLGHGEGAIIASMLAAKDSKIAFLILLSPPAVPGVDVLLEQTAQAEAVGGVPDDQVEADHAIGTELYKLVMEGKGEAELRAALKKFSKQAPQPVIQNWERQIPRLGNPWLKFFLSYSPASALEHVSCPVLALYGENDLQVIPQQNAPELEKALKHAHNHDVSVQLLPKLNYMFQTSNTGLGWEVGAITETMSPVALQAIETWLAKHGIGHSVLSMNRR
jgi:uncharacterized protein